ncbi:MAG: hypothetical protein ACHQU1_02665 [Gemmatimonadales bacterium]
MDDAESAPAIGWARPWAIAKPFLVPSPRAGAWYPIVADATENRVVLEILGKKVAVHRHLVEIRERRPDKFTVVNRLKADVDPDANGGIGKHYAVCPSCNARVPLFAEPPSLTCGTCQHTGQVAYWETG